MDDEKILTYLASLDAQNIKSPGISWFSMPVVLTGSDNPLLPYPVRGVLRICEQGTNLMPVHAVFHCLQLDGKLRAPVTAKNPNFRFDGTIFGAQ